MPEPNTPGDSVQAFLFMGGDPLNLTYGDEAEANALGVHYKKKNEEFY